MTIRVAEGHPRRTTYVVVFRGFESRVQIQGSNPACAGCYRLCAAGTGVPSVAKGAYFVQHFSAYSGIEPDRNSVFSGSSWLDLTFSLGWRPRRNKERCLNTDNPTNPMPVCPRRCSDRQKHGIHLSITPNTKRRPPSTSAIDNNTHTHTEPGSPTQKIRSSFSSTRPASTVPAA